MPRISVHNVGTLGVIKDLPPHVMPPEAWSDGRNARFIDGQGAKIAGHTQVFSGSLHGPEFAMTLQTAAQIFWIYASLNKASVYEGGSHFDITRASGDYTTADGRDWNGGVLGGIPILNNGANIPQYWPSLNVATRLDNLPNWTVGAICKVMRPFRNFLIALNITESGVQKPHRVRWSSSADPGTVPQTWDPSDPTKDSGEFDLSDVNAGAIVEAFPLRDAFVIYKENSTWAMRFIGGQSIF